MSGMMNANDILLLEIVPSTSANVENLKICRISVCFRLALRAFNI